MFDSLTSISINEMSAADVAAEKISLYKKRREDAVTLWTTIPSDQFDINNWEICAIGWLARKKHDGWSLVGGLPWRGGENCTPASNKYFGLKCDGMMRLCHPINIFNKHHPVYNNKSDVTLADVSAALLAAPYTI